MKQTVNDDYWELRGRRGYDYRGERFYTVTPIPYYAERRRRLYELLEPLVADRSVSSACDFGCGDGHYLKHFHEVRSDIEWHGVDAAQSMIEHARHACPFATFHVSRTGIPSGCQFDLVSTIAVFAHIKDEELLGHIVDSIHSALRPNGAFALFEQTGPSASGSTWSRRPTSAYIGLLEQHGFDVLHRHLLAFPIHRLFEKYVATLYYRFIACGNDLAARRINANRSGLFRALSRLALQFDRRNVWPDEGRQSGNTLYLCRKHCS